MLLGGMAVVALARSGVPCSFVRGLIREGRGRVVCGAFPGCLRGEGAGRAFA